MSFIEKSDNIVINAKLTSLGRKLLASGSLTFSKWAFGDSEIDYTYAFNSGMDLSLTEILRPKDSNPNLKYPILPSSSSVDAFNDVGTITPVETIVINSAAERGFFTGSSNNYSAKTSGDIVVQADARIFLSGVTGGTILHVNRTSTFSGGSEPVLNDYILIMWNNPYMSGLTESKGVIYNGRPSPYLWYKIQGLTGTLSANTLTLTVDRALPNFNGFNNTGSSQTARAIFYPSGNSISEFYSTGNTTAYWNDNTLAFNSSCNIANDNVPVWNMNLVYTENIAGVNTVTYEGIYAYSSSGYTGVKNYLSYTTDSPSQKVVGVIHYTNHSISNYYGESLSTSTPVLELPTVMWYNSSGSTIGLTLTCDTTKQTTVSGSTPLVTTFYNLLDPYGNIVGKCFNDLKIFIIEDEELIAAMSYKSNRNWTLPKLNFLSLSNPSVGEGGLLNNSEVIHLTYLFENTSGFTVNKSLGYSTPLHCQYYLTLTGNSGTDKVVTFNLPSSNLVNFMRNHHVTPYTATSFTTYSGTGWNGQKFKVLAQITGLNERPDPTLWKIIDFTNRINNYSTWSGNTIPATEFDSSAPFRLDNILYTGASTYDLSTYLTLPTLSQPTKLNFSDEVFFFGNVKTNIEATIYQTKLQFKAPFNQFNESQNPTWDASQSVYISEVGIYSNTGDLVAIGKLSYPLEKKNTQVRIIGLSIDF